MIEWILAHSHYFLLIVIAAGIKQEIKRGFTGRTSLVANTSSILAVAGPFWSSLPWFLHWWVLLSIPICLLAFFTYITDTSMPTDFYKGTWLLYNSVFAALFILILG